MAFPLKTVRYHDMHKLRLHVYVVGYPAEGESILVVVAEDTKPLLIIVTDCYETADGYNHVSEILRTEWGSPSLDAFIWTHPHKDHSLGILTLIDKHDKKHEGYVISPTNMVGLQHYKGPWEESSQILRALLKNYPIESYQYYFRGLDPQVGPLQFRLTAANGPVLNLDLYFVAPPPALVARYMGNKTCPANKGSLAFLLSINGIDVFMGGDLDEECVRYISNDVYRHVNLIKIPHHGSEHTGDIHKKFGLNSCDDPCAATTVFSKCKDPKDKILKGYVDGGCIVHCTGPAPGQAPQEVFGCLHYIYNLASSTLEDLRGSANTYQFLGDQVQPLPESNTPTESSTLT